jgi:queuine tRNA-ribosyltransferase
MFEFTITAKNKRARTGIFTTPHGDLLTPVFAPVGTQAVSPWLPVCKKAMNKPRRKRTGYHLLKSEITYNLLLTPQSGGVFNP